MVPPVHADVVPVHPYKSTFNIDKPKVNPVNCIVNDIFYK
jgi:hypothetical protein